MAVTVFTEADFVEAVKKQLPPGDYWSDSDDLQGVTAAIGKELYQTYLETKQSFLNQDNRSETNWRVADYQALLDLYQKGAVASDNPLTPNVIDVLLTNSDGIIAMMNSLDLKRLPHTAINYKMPFGFAFASGVRLISYQRIEAIGS